MRTKSLRVLLITLLLAFVLAGCNSSDNNNTDPSNGRNGNNSTVTSKPDNTDPGNTATQAPDPDQIGNDKIDLGDLDSEKLKEYPSEALKSNYYFNAKELSDETFFPDQEDILGDPYIFNGTILEESDSIVDYFSLNQVHGPELVNLDATGKAFEVMTKYGKVMMIDVSGYQTKFLNDNLKGNVMGLEYYKSWYNNLMPYKKLPEVGDTGRFNTIYFGYSMQDECPVFLYGASQLSRAGFFEINYPKFVSDKTKKTKYRSLFTIEYPVGWSEPIENGSQIEIYMPESAGGLIMYDMEDAELSLEDAVKMVLGEEEYDMPEFDEDPDVPAFNIEDYLKVKTKEKIMIGDGTVSAYHLAISVRNDDPNNVSWQDQDIIAFKAKRSIVLMVYFFYDDGEDHSEDPGLELGTDIYTEETENNSSEEIDDFHSKPGNELRSILLKEIEGILKTIVIQGL